MNNQYNSLVLEGKEKAREWCDSGTPYPQPKNPYLNANGSQNSSSIAWFNGFDLYLDSQINYMQD